MKKCIFMWAKKVLSCTRKLVKPSFKFLQLRNPGCVRLAKFYFTVTLYNFIVMVCCRVMKHRECLPVILVYLVLVLLGNSNAAASSKLEHDPGFMQGWFRDVFIYNYSFCPASLWYFWSNLRLKGKCHIP